MEELQRQIIAIQLIQELIVDKLDESGIVSRDDFEVQLQIRVKELNKKIDALSIDESKNESKTPPIFYNNIVGEA